MFITSIYPHLEMALSHGLSDEGKLAVEFSSYLSITLRERDLQIAFLCFYLYSKLILEVPKPSP